MKTAKLLKENLKGFQGYASLYELSEPIAERRFTDVGEEEVKHKYVIVSSANVPFSGPETYIFPARKSGEIVNWGELSGSMRGSHSHEDVLREAGYEVVGSVH